MQNEATLRGVVAVVANGVVAVVAVVADGVVAVVADGVVAVVAVVWLLKVWRQWCGD